MILVEARIICPAMFLFLCAGILSGPVIFAWTFTLIPPTSIIVMLGLLAAAAGCNIRWADVQDP